MKLPKLALPTSFNISMPKLKKDKPVQLNMDSPSGKEAKQKKMLRGAIAIMAVVFVGLAMHNQGGSTNKKVNKLPSAMHEQAQQDKATAKADSKKDSQKSKIHITTDIANINPFIADDSMEGSDVVVDAATSTPIYKNSGSASANLPVIPGRQPKANLPTIPNGGQPRDEAQAQPQQSAPAKVQGVFIGGDSNMAVMSDGSVISEGEYYNDNRISWIGGDGVHFENGETIRYR